MTAQPYKTDPWFEVFWKKYPRKKDKGDAWKAWRSLKIDEKTFMTILEALDWQAPIMRKQEPVYQKYPAGWLRGWRWMDEREKGQVATEEKRSKCVTCDGKGFDTNTGALCPKCGGRGSVAVHQRLTRLPATLELK
jgi:hypothetical protein